jgi:anti-sigma factor RsiW
MKSNEPACGLPERFRELVRLLIDEELTGEERAEMKRALKSCDEARSYLAEALAESTLLAVRKGQPKLGSVRLPS